MQVIETAPHSHLPQEALPSDSERNERVTVQLSRAKVTWQSEQWGGWGIICYLLPIP